MLMCLYWRVFCAYSPPSSVFAGQVQRADMMSLLEAFRARAKSELNIEFDITKETKNVVDLKPRRTEPPLPFFPCISFVLHSRVETIEAVLAQFDISVCQVAMRVATSREEILKRLRFVATETVTSHIRQKTMQCLVDLTKTSRNIVASRQRILK